MADYSFYEIGDKVNVRYNGIVQSVEIVGNDITNSVLLLKVIVGGCCGGLKYENRPYSYDNFHLDC